MTKSLRWRKWLLLAAGVVAAWQVTRLFTTQRSSTDKLVNQLWVERMPADARDMVWHLVTIDHEGRHRGAIGKASRWRVHNDGFVWRLEGDRFTFVTPQNRCRITAQARTWKCEGDAPQPFDLCLELTGQGGKRYRYYSRTDWEIKPHGQLDADDQTSFALPAVAAALATPDDDGGGDAEVTGECAVGPE